MATMTKSRSMSSSEVQALRERFVPKGLHVATPVVVSSADDAMVTDPEGREYIDFISGIGALNLGHQHPDLIAAARDQLDRYTHLGAQVVTYEPYVRLAQELDRIYPRGTGAVATKSVFMNSGAEAVENAMKIARVATGREFIIAFQNSFHGRTYAAMTATGKTKNSRLPFLRSASTNVVHVPYPYPYRPLVAGTEDELAALHARLLEQVLETNLAPEHVAAVLIEPVQGEGGFIVPPSSFIPRIAEICKRHGILLIADEVQTGFGRTARMFAIERSGVTPDLLVTSKSLGGGFPIGAVTGRAELMDALKPGELGATFGGNPVACATALATIAVIERDGLLSRAEAIGQTIRTRLVAMAERHGSIGDVRGVGAMQAIELVTDRVAKTPAPKLVDAIAKTACEHGLLVLRAGLYGNVIRTLVPLTIGDDRLHAGLDILDSAIATNGR
jgi:4-aminobutyrate aminotransferase/(S)-3-amino-2-methylpropionate transaminase